MDKSKNLSENEKTNKRENRTRRLSFNLTERRFADFLTLFERSGMNSYAHFIEARVFNESFKVIKVDKSAMGIYNQLCKFHAQFRAVGVNYNQLIKALKSNFTEKKAYVIVQKLHKETMKLTDIHEQVLKLAIQIKEQNDSQNRNK